jgi:hypothetical protein
MYITSNCCVCTTCAVVYNVQPVLLCICHMYCCLYATSHVLFVVYHMSCYVYSTYTLACKYEYSTFAVVYCISHVCFIYTTCAIICYMRCCLYITTCVVFFIAHEMLSTCTTFDILYMYTTWEDTCTACDVKFIPHEIMFTNILLYLCCYVYTSWDVVDIHRLSCCVYITHALLST